MFSKLENIIEKILQEEFNLKNIKVNLQVINGTDPNKKLLRSQIHDLSVQELNKVEVLDGQKIAGLDVALEIINCLEEHFPGQDEYSCELRENGIIKGIATITVEGAYKVYEHKQPEASAAAHHP